MNGRRKPTLTPETHMLTPTIFRVALGTVAAAMLLAAGSATAGADTITSDNWAGYAAHGSNAHFKQVTATWMQPKARCTAGNVTYSSFWVGIGGYNLNSTAMEQMGTELDCDGDGSQAMSAWYELVPAAPRTIHMTIASGDVITSTVDVVGDRVTMKLEDATRHESFTKTITDHSTDTTSAEWIAEAPSNCSGSSCTTLPLADFGTATFADASATTTSGRTAPIVSSLWSTTKLLLGYLHEGSAFVAKSASANATPSKLVHGNSAFLVVYSSNASGSSGQALRAASSG
jgi:Peptidase A4 family